MYLQYNLIQSAGIDYLSVAAFVDSVSTHRVFFESRVRLVVTLGILTDNILIEGVWLTIKCQCFIIQ